ncbi:putative phage protein [Vibrio maritimus]|uniref:Putative phage protein n=1 Tax=Vibrio maritimus TaxID=990268 RepID=A0A090S8H9_9VIBR|nr:putative phage protein [Vibrio maritimus]
MDDRFDWSTSKIIEKEYYPEDMLEHARYADFLTRFLVSQGFDKSREVGEQEKNYVLNLNSAWGSGKTYFLRRWAEDLKAHYPVVYVDAWKKDYSDDPLMTVVSAIISCLSAQAGKDQDSVIKSKLPRKILGLLKAAAPGAASAFGKRYFGIDPVALMTAKDDEELGHFNDSEGNPVQDENGNALDMGAAASQAVKYLIDEHEAKTEAIESLKTAVKQWSGLWLV